jgi:hypothetical protein
MSEAIETKPRMPDNARLLEVGEIINDGDLHWNATVKHWVRSRRKANKELRPGKAAFTPQERRLGDFQFNDLAI